MIRNWLKKNFSFLLGNSWVLMYHHVSAPSTDPWDLIVTPENFEKQLIWYKRNCRIFSLEDLVTRWKNKTLEKHSIALSFDDGYRDNFQLARPLLEKHHVPATFFITTENMLFLEPFWWDELQAVVLETKELPQVFSAMIGNREITVNLDSETQLSSETEQKIKAWRWPSEPPGLRASLYMQLHTALKDLPTPERKQGIKTIKDWSGSLKLETPALMDMQEIRELSEHPLFSIGAHTRTHLALGSASDEVQLREMKESKEQLEDLLQITVPFQAYPYGSYNNMTLNLASLIQYEASFTTQPIPIRKSTNPSFLGRLQVTDTMDLRAIR
jgi:peptidoglycan/xylan/chitin deacetylase (PgdA/CDA1 family)